MTLLDTLSPLVLKMRGYLEQIQHRLPDHILTKGLLEIVDFLQAETSREKSFGSLLSELRKIIFLLRQAYHDDRKMEYTFITEYAKAANMEFLRTLTDYSVLNDMTEDPEFLLKIFFLQCGGAVGFGFFHDETLEKKFQQALLKGNLVNSVLIFLNAWVAKVFFRGEANFASSRVSLKFILDQYDRDAELLKIKKDDPILVNIF